jgi:hypothetical protein
MSTEHDQGDFDADAFYVAKFGPDGNVREGWSHVEWTMKRMAGCRPTSSRNAHTAARR